jgi:copper chaperone CopZ
MKKIIISLLLLPSLALAGELEHDMHHNHDKHENHLHEMVDGQEFQLDKERFNKFVSGLSNAQIAVLSVEGMVCDFCARGIEKTFKKDAGYLNIDVDLSHGKVLIAYDMSVLIDKSDVEKKILSNGQNLVDIQILSVP